MNFTIRHNGSGFVDSTVIEWASGLSRQEADHLKDVIGLILEEPEFRAPVAAELHRRAIREFLRNEEARVAAAGTSKPKKRRRKGKGV